MMAIITHIKHSIAYSSLSSSASGCLAKTKKQTTKTNTDTNTSTNNNLALLQNHHLACRSVISGLNLVEVSAR